MTLRRLETRRRRLRVQKWALTFWLMTRAQDASGCTGTCVPCPCVFRFINVWHRLMQHVLLPDIRAFMAPPESMASDGSIIQVRLQARALLLQRNSRGCRLRAPASCTRCSSAADAQQRTNKAATCTRRCGVIYIASVGTGRGSSV